MTPFVKNALSLLDAGRISDAISYIRKRLIADRNSARLDAISRIDQTYTFLLKYLAEGQQDPQRDRMFSNIREELYAIVYAVQAEIEGNESPKLYHSTSRTLKYSSVNFSEALGRFISADSALQFAGITNSPESLRINADRDRALKDIFALTWTIPSGERDSLKAIANVAADNDMPFELRALIIGGLYLSLNCTYDRNKYLALLDIYSKSESEKLQARALTALLLILNQHRARIENDLEIAYRFEALTDRDSFRPRLRAVFFELVKARGGINLAKKIESEILPDIMKESPKIIDKLKDKEGKISIENIEEAGEWDSLMSKRMGKKLKKLGDLQSSGGDVMLSMFDKLSGRYHFFNEIDSWFRPFSKADAVRLGVPSDFAVLWEDFPSYNTACDTDKFILALNMAQLPEQAKNMMGSGLMQHSEQMKEEFKSMELHLDNPEFNIEAQNFSRVLFRFFNYFRVKGEFENPFAASIDIFSLPFLGDFPDRDEILDNLSDFYFHQGFYEDAIRTLRILEKKDVLNFAAYEKKIGYCREKLEQSSEALECYRKAYEAGEDDEWLLKKLYNLGVMTGNTQIAYDALSKLVEADKNNLNNVINLIDLILRHPEISKSDKLDSLLGRAYYMAPDDVKVQRFMAAGEGHKGNYEKGLEYLAPRMADISMYLAEEALKSAGRSAESQAGSSENADGTAEEISKRFLETREMSEALIEDATLRFAMNDLKGAISSLAKIFDLKESGRKRIEVEDALKKKWSSMPPMRAHLPRLTMYLEAALRKS